MQDSEILRGASICIEQPCSVLWQGWTYGLDGVLLKATRINGIENFDVNVCNYIIVISVCISISM